jgi:lipoprotein NlpI
MARDEGVQKARAALLPIRNDRRIPMMKIYDLYRGKAKPEDVLAAAAAGKPSAQEINERLFYAHLYVGLYHEAEGNAAAAKTHLRRAAQKHKIDHYMWDVANVHVARLEEK